MDAKNILDLNFLTYIAGVLVPTTSISITSSFNAVPTATVTMPPYPQLYGIGRKDRVPVHIFIKDFVIGEYVLLFEGEIDSFSYSNSNSGRDIVINAKSVLNFLQDVKLRLLHTLEDVIVYDHLGNQDTALNVFMPKEHFPSCLFSYGLSGFNEQSKIKYPVDYLQNMLDYVIKGGGSNSSNGKLNDSALAKFYSEHAKKLRLGKRYTHVPIFDNDESSEVWADSGGGVKMFPLVAGMQTVAALQTMDQIVTSGMQQEDSIIGMINFLVNQMEYECAFFSSPTVSLSGDQVVSMVLKPVFFDAIPPACNVIYQSHTVNLASIERVYEVPTRVLARDVNGVFSKMAKDASSVFREIGIQNYYPTKLSPAETYNEPKIKWLNTELLNEDESDTLLSTEKQTGPWIYETSPPSWMSYLGPAAVGKSLGVFRDKMLKRLLMHKQYEFRSLQVNTGFNYYITPGFPGIVYDSDDSDFAFCGHIYTVSHNISKESVTTTVDMGFVRLLSDAMNNPIPNPIAGVDTVSKDEIKMSAITQNLIGCDSYGFETLQNLKDSEQQKNPFSAYCSQFRRIITLDDYCKFMGFRYEKSTVGGDSIVPTQLLDDSDSSYFNTRRRLLPGSVPKFVFDKDSSVDYTSIISILKAISMVEFGNTVYSGGDVLDHTEFKSATATSLASAMEFPRKMFNAVDGIKSGIQQEISKSMDLANKVREMTDVEALKAKAFAPLGFGSTPSYASMFSGWDGRMPKAEDIVSEVAIDPGVATSKKPGVATSSGRTGGSAKNDFGVSKLTGQDLEAYSYTNYVASLTGTSVNNSTIMKDISGFTQSAATNTVSSDVVKSVYPSSITSVFSDALPKERELSKLFTGLPSKDALGNDISAKLSNVLHAIVAKNTTGTYTDWEKTTNEILDLGIIQANPYMSTEEKSALVNDLARATGGQTPVPSIEIDWDKRYSSHADGMTLHERILSAKSIFSQQTWDNFDEAVKYALADIYLGASSRVGGNAIYISMDLANIFKASTNFKGEIRWSKVATSLENLGSFKNNPNIPDSRKAEIVSILSQV